MPASPIVQTRQGVGQAFGGGQESLARRKAAAEMVATNALEKQEGGGALIAGLAPALLSTAGSVVGGVFGGPAGAKAGSAVGGGIGEAIGSLDTSEQEAQQAEQELENIRAEEEGRAPQQIKAKKSGTKQAASMIGSLGKKLAGNMDGEEGGGISDFLSSINLGG